MGSGDRREPEAVSAIRACRRAVECSVVRVGAGAPGPEYATGRVDSATAEGTVGTERWAGAPAHLSGVSGREAARSVDNGAVSGTPHRYRVDPRQETGRTTAQRAGDAAECLVAAHLVGLGWTILGRNVRVGRQEIDLVAFDPGPPRWVVLVEVRWRARRDFGLGEETFDRRKQGHLRAALVGLAEARKLPDGRPLPTASFRVDLVVVEPSRGAGARRGPTDRPRIRHHRHALGG